MTMNLGLKMGGGTSLEGTATPSDVRSGMTFMSAFSDELQTGILALSGTYGGQNQTAATSGNPVSSITTSGDHNALVVSTIGVIGDDESGVTSGAGTLNVSNGCTATQIVAASRSDGQGDYYSYALYHRLFLITKSGGKVPSGTTISYTPSLGGGSGVRRRNSFVSAVYIDN